MNSRVRKLIVAAALTLVLALSISRAGSALLTHRAVYDLYQGKAVAAADRLASSSNLLARAVATLHTGTPTKVTDAYWQSLWTSDPAALPPSALWWRMVANFADSRSDMLDRDIALLVQSKPDAFLSRANGLALTPERLQVAQFAARARAKQTVPDAPSAPQVEALLESILPWERALLLDAAGRLAARAGDRNAAIGWLEKAMDQTPVAPKSTAELLVALLAEQGAWNRALRWADSSTSPVEVLIEAQKRISTAVTSGTGVAVSSADAGNRASRERRLKLAALWCQAQAISWDSESSATAQARYLEIAQAAGAIGDPPALSLAALCFERAGQLHLAYLCHGRVLAVAPNIATTLRLNALVGRSAPLAMKVFPSLTDDGILASTMAADLSPADRCESDNALLLRSPLTLPVETPAPGRYELCVALAGSRAGNVGALIQVLVNGQPGGWLYAANDEWQCPVLKLAMPAGLNQVTLAFANQQSGPAADGSTRSARILWIGVRSDTGSTE